MSEEYGWPFVEKLYALYYPDADDNAMDEMDAVAIMASFADGNAEDFQLLLANCRHEMVIATLAVWLLQTRSEDELRVWVQQFREKVVSNHFDRENPAP